ncbi:hypothetical protein [Parabacteroides merdae]|uniref:hypothetical protein n=1 Tax=Parabacteroides merdae TaxID=46503 RepID=UPI003F60907E
MQIYKTFFNPIAYEQDSFIFETKQPLQTPGRRFYRGAASPDTVRGLIRSRHRSLLAGAQRQAPGRSLGLDGLDTHRDRRSNRRIDFPRYLTRGLAFIRTFAPRWSFLIVRVVYRGYNNANANGGVSNANANNDASNSNTNVGSRLEI